MDCGIEIESGKEGKESDDEIPYSEDERNNSELESEGQGNDDEENEKGSSNEAENNQDSEKEDEECISDAENEQGIDNKETEGNISEAENDDSGENELIINSEHENDESRYSSHEDNNDESDSEIHLSDLEGSEDEERNSNKQDCDQENNSDEICDNKNESANDENSLLSMDLDSDNEMQNEENKESVDNEDEAEEQEKKELIANIFGESEDEQEEEDKIDRPSKKKKKHARIVASDDSDSEAENKFDDGEHELDDGQHEPDDEEKPEEATSDAELEEISVEESEGKHKEPFKGATDDVSDDEGESRNQGHFVSDFDLMMQKKRESARKRKRKNVDIINDSDDLIAEIIQQMKQAADEDRELNKQKKTATKKLKILPLVLSQLKKHDLKMAFLDQGVLSVMADWLAPLPDKSLPNLKIRDGMLRQLQDFPVIDQSSLKASGIGRAIMYIYKHPLEMKENKARAGKIIRDWASTIFNVTTDYHSLTKEEREQRDYDHVPKKKKSKDDAPEPEVPRNKDINEALDENEVKLRPGDKGWVPRARVPMPSNKDYVVRPKWNVEADFGRSAPKKPLNRFEKHMKLMQEKKRNSKAQRAVTISIEGRNMKI